MKRLFAVWTILSFLFASIVWPLAAFAVVPEVGGPFSPYPPYTNPWLSQPGSTYTNTSTGADITRNVSRTVGTSSVNIAIKDSVTKAAITRAVSRGIGALCTTTLVGGIACAAAAEYGIEQGYHLCQSQGWCRPDPTTVVAGYVWSGYNNASGFPSADSGCNSYTGFQGWSVTFTSMNASGTTASCYGTVSSGSAVSLLVNISRRVATGASPPPAPTPPDLASGPPQSDPGFVPWLTDWQGNSSRPGPAVNTRSPGLAQQTSEGGYAPDDPSFEPTTPTTVSAPPVTGTPTTTTSSGTNSAGQPTTTTTTQTPTITTGQTGTTVSNTTITNNISTTTTTTVTNNTTGAVESSTTSTTSAPAADTGPKECGTPGRPKCQIDETGTPTDSTVPFTNPKTDQDTAQKQITDAVANEGNNSANLQQKTRWTFTFSLPSGCTSIDLFLGVKADPCQWQEMIHDLMSMLWVGGTVVGIIQGYGRSFGGTA